MSFTWTGRRKKNFLPTCDRAVLLCVVVGESSPTPIRYVPVRPVLSCSIPPRSVVYLTTCITRMRGAVHYIISKFCQSSYFAIDQPLLFTWKILIYFQVNILFVTFEYCAVYVRGINNAVLVFYMTVLNGTTG